VLVQSILEARANECPHKVAIIAGDRELSYRELDSSANHLAHALRDHGVERGDRVLVYLDNRPEAVVALFAIWKADAICVAVHRGTRERKLARIVRDCSPAAFVIDWRAVAAMRPFFERLPPPVKFVVAVDCPIRNGSDPSVDVASWEHLQSVTPGARPSTSNDDTDLAALVYTSGTTGEPKGVMEEHAAMLFATDRIVEYLGNDEHDVVLSVLPISFSYGLYQVLAMVRCGGTVVLENSFAFPAHLLKLVSRHRVTGLPGVPTVFSTLLQSDLTGYDLSTLRYVTNAAAPLAPAHIRQWRARLPEVSLYSMYGMTEVVRALYLPPDWIDAKPDSVGIGIPGIDVWLEDEDGTRLGPGQVGELVVRGRNVMRGYWRRPDETKKRFRSGASLDERCCRTGDLFWKDADGCMYFVGRQDDMIKCRGEKVSPKEIEDCLHELSGVVEAAVVGIPDPVQGHAVKSVIVRSDPALDALRVRSHCRRYLDDVSVPTIVEFRDSLPRSPSGKVLRKELI